MIEKEITLQAGDTAYVLSPTLSTLRTVAKRWPRLVDALNEIRGLNFEACSTIVAASTGLKLDKAEAVVFEAGLVTTAAACADLLSALINPAGDDDDGKPSGNL